MNKDPGDESSTSHPRVDLSTLLMSVETWRGECGYVSEVVDERRQRTYRMKLLDDGG